MTTDATALILATGLMGLAGLPHCAAMCAAPCAAVARGGAAEQLWFQGARVAGYAAAGALAAWSVGALREGLAVAPALRPLWTLLHLAALAVGLWMLWRGRWPAWLRRGGGAGPLQPMHAAAGGASVSWQRMAGPARSTCAGALWIAWPCALSQAALLVAALASTPGQGAAAMGAFAVASSPALWLGPMVVARLRAWRAGPGGDIGAARRPGAGTAWPLRAAGGLIALGSAFALGHGLWARVAAWCGLG